MMVIQNPYYDPVALGDYLAKTRGQGLTPEFTNIPGAPGFQVGTSAPIEEEEEDILALPEIESITDKDEAYKIHIVLAQELDDAIFDRRQEIEEEEGIPKLQREITHWKATGLGESPDLAIKEEELIVAYQEANKKLIAGKDGLSGIEAPNYRTTAQYLKRLYLHAQRLDEPKEEPEFSDIKKVLLKHEMNLDAVPAYANLIGKDLEEVTATDLAFLNEDEQKLIKAEVENHGTTNAVQVIENAPEALSLFKNKIKDPDLIAEIDSLDKEAKEAKKAAIPQEWMTVKDGVSRQLTPAELRIEGITTAIAKEQKEFAEDKAVVTAILGFQDRVRKEKLDLQLNVVPNLTDKEQEVLNVLGPKVQTYLDIASNPNTNPSHIWARRANLQVTLNEAARTETGKVGSIKRPEGIQALVYEPGWPTLHELLRKINVGSIDNFNKRYSNTLGVDMTYKLLPKGVQ